MCMKRTSRKTRVFFREWRKFRGLSQERAAAIIGVDRTSLGRIENGKQVYSEPVIEAMAEAYKCDVSDLFVRDPSDPEGIWSIWDTLPQPKRPQAVAVLKTLRDTGT